MKIWKRQHEFGGRIYFSTGQRSEARYQKKYKNF